MMAPRVTAVVAHLPERPGSRTVRAAWARVWRKPIVVDNGTLKRR